MTLPNPGNAQILADINARLGRGLTDWAPWTSIIELYGTKITEWSERYGPAYTEEMGNFFLSWPGVGSTDRDDSEWICHGLLGKGGFGMVGHWLRPDAAGVVIDQIAIKQNLSNKKVAVGYWYEVGREIPGEAIHNISMQSICDNVTKLRKMKVYTTTTPDTWRLYFGYCPYGDLYDLTTRYRRWNRQAEVYFPEEFLWHVFQQLARVALAMANGPFPHMRTGAILSDRFYLHLDIKDANILIDIPSVGSDFPFYPTVRVGDWGIAQRATDFEPRRINPHSYLERGTRAYFTPEQILGYPRNLRSQIINRNVRAPRNTNLKIYNDAQGKRLRITPTLNVWAFGAVMFQLMTLDQLNAQLNAAWARCSADEDACAQDGYNLIPEIISGRAVEYSQELRSLIRQCLNVAPALRPEPGELLHRTEEGLRACKEKMVVEGRSAQAVYLRGDDPDPPAELMRP